MAISFDYSRGRRPVSPRRNGISSLCAAFVAGVLLTAALPAVAQYQGPANKTKKKTPELRAVAVVEWTGKEGDPKASRIIPLTIWNGEQLQDASVYMAQPAPLALDTQVEYQLERDGKPVGLYVVQTAGQLQGSWVGRGVWKPLPKPKPEKKAEKPAKVHLSGEGGPPILHIKGQPEDKSDSKDKKDKAEAERVPIYSGRPILVNPPEESKQDKKDKKPEAQTPQNDEAYVQPLANITYPGFSRLKLGGPVNLGPKVLPKLVGLPQDMHQIIGVSDAADRPVHVWNYSWPSASEEAAMKSQLEKIARKDLAPALAAAKPVHKGTISRRKGHAAPVAPAAPLTLVDEKFQAFALTYGAGPTMVFSAHTAGTGAQEKFITLIAQPALYGDVAVVLKHVTDAAHLADTPLLKLIGPVDALADNRAELLFEERGATQREFVLYRVLLGRVQTLFTSAPEIFVIPPEEHAAG